MGKKERLVRAFNFLRTEGIIKTQKDVAIAMRSSEPNISSALKGKEKSLTDPFLVRFAETFKQISLNWLLYEEGPMLTMEAEFKSENTPQVMLSEVDKDVIEEQAKITDRIMQLVNAFGHTPKTFALKADIEISLFLKKLKGDAFWSVADVHKICDVYRIRKGWLVDGEGQQFRLPDEILETIPARRTYNPCVGVPYYNVDFQMGFDSMENDQTVTPEYMVNFHPYNRADAWCNASGDSMHPTISNGDTLTLIPDNKDYSEQTISKDVVLKVYKVLGSVKMF